MDMLTTLYDRLFAEVPTSHVGCFLFTMAIAEDLRNTFSMIKTLYYVPAVRLGRLHRFEILPFVSPSPPIAINKK